MAEPVKLDAWWDKKIRVDSARAIAENPLMYTSLERVLVTRMKIWMREMDEVQAPAIVDDLRRFCERYAGTPGWPAAIAVATQLELA